MHLFFLKLNSSMTICFFLPGKNQFIFIAVLMHIFIDKSNIEHLRLRGLNIVILSHNKQIKNKKKNKKYGTK